MSAQAVSNLLVIVTQNHLLDGHVTMPLSLFAPLKPTLCPPRSGSSTWSMSRGKVTYFGENNLLCPYLVSVVILCCRGDYHVTLFEVHIPPRSSSSVLKCVCVYASDSIISDAKLRYVMYTSGVAVHAGVYLWPQSLHCWRASRGQ